MGLESCKRDEKMDKKPRCEPKRKMPGRALDEWDNNRIYRIGATYAKEFLRLQEGEPPENVRAYADFLKRAEFEGISVVRRLNYIRALLALKAIRRGAPLGEISQEDISGFLDSLSHLSAGTIRLRFFSLKRFLKFLGKPELLEGIRPPPDDDVKVRASDLLTREDIQKLIEACPTVRGRAFLMTLYESGARIGELLNARLGDFEFDANGVLVEIDGKTGRRRIRLVESAKHLRDWFKELKESHPGTHYVWFGKGDEPSQYAATLKFLRKTAKTAGLRKKVYPHLFRHSRASELAQKLREPQLRAFMGWGAASDMPRIYVHLSAQDMDRAILELYAQPQEKNVVMDEMAQFYAFWKQMKAAGCNSPGPCQAPR